MAMNDEVKQQRGKLKGKPLKEKLQYFWDYYKVHTIVGLIALFVVGIFIKDAVTARDYAVCATFLNAFGMDSQEAIQADFAAYAGIDTDILDCSIDASSTLSYDVMSQMDLAVSQRIVAMSQIGGIDVLISDPDPFTNFAEGGLFGDLKETLTEEEYARYEKQFYYIDKAALADDNEMNYDENGTPQVVDSGIDHSDPSAMEDPVPVGIYVTDAPKLKEFGCYKDSKEVVYGFPWSSERPEMAHTLLEWLYSEAG